MNKKQFTQTLKEVAEEKAPAVDLWPEIERQLTPRPTRWTRGLQLAGGLAGAVVILVAVLLFAGWMASLTSESDQASAPGPDLRLLGSTIHPRNPVPGDTLTVTLRWQTPAQPQPDVHLFLHLLNPDGHIAVQADTPLEEAAWPVPHTLTTTHSLSLPPALSPGIYTLRAGVYDRRTQQRLPLRAGGQRLADGTATVGTTTVLPASAAVPEGPWAGEPVYSESDGISRAAHNLFQSCGLEDEQIEAAVRLFQGSGTTRQVIQPGLSETDPPWRKIVDVVPVTDTVYRVTCLYLEGDTPVPASPEALLANLRLLEANLDRTSFAPAAPLSLGTTWQNSLGIDPQAGQFIHLFDEEGNLVAQRDRSLPFDSGDGVTSQISFTDTLYLPSTLPPGPYRLVLGLYRRDNGWRLPFSTGDGEMIPAGSLSLATIQIQAEPAPLPPDAETIALDLAAVDQMGTSTWTTINVAVDLDAWNVNPNDASGILPSLTLSHPVVRDAAERQYSLQRVSGNTPDRWQDPYPAKVTLALEMLPAGTYTLETGISLVYWPAAGSLVVDLSDRQVGESWPLTGTVTIGNLAIPLETATLNTRPTAEGEELVLELTVPAVTGADSALTCLHLEPDLAALGLPSGSGECQPELVENTISRITAVVTIDTTEGDGTIAVPPRVRLQVSGDLEIDGPWSLSWDVPPE